MKSQLIAKINGTNIVTVNRDNEVYVPIKPICEALGIDFAAQYNKITSDEDLNSVIAIIATTGADGKTYNMVCLPLKFIYGWLFTINPGKVAPEAKEEVRRYRRECYEALYEHFTTSMTRTIETNNAEIKLLNELNNVITEEKEIKSKRKNIEQTLKQLRSERLNNEPVLF